MITRNVLIFFSFLILNVSFGQEASFEIINKPKQLEQGELVTGVIRLWPFSHLEKDELQVLTGKSFFGSLKLQKIINIDRSENNYDVIELTGYFIVLNAIKNKDDYVQYEDVTLRVQAPIVEIKELKEKSNEFIILDQALSASSILIIISLVILALFLLLYVFRIKIMHFFQNKEKKLLKEKIEKYKGIFLDAKSRKDYENIYSLREEWLLLVKLKTPSHYDFLKLINENQYKEIWTKEEHQLIEESFSQIRRSFE